MIKHDFYDRFRYILSDPFNIKIKRHDHAGKIIDNYLIMYNGLKIVPGSYCGSFSDILILNQGVHEPQEEYVFCDVIKKITKNNPIMIELGSYWAFYSMSFLQENPQGQVFLIEEDERYLDIGKKHFQINSMNGTFIHGKISRDDIKLDSFVEEYNIPKINILHSDIQGFEIQMLEGAKNVFSKHLIDYVFISTHHQNIHLHCLKFLINNKYTIIGSADVDNETFCHDGIIIACSKNIDYPKIDLGNRSQSSLFDEKELDRKLEKLYELL